MLLNWVLMVLWLRVDRFTTGTAFIVIADDGVPMLLLLMMMIMIIIICMFCVVCGRLLRYLVLHLWSLCHSRYPRDIEFGILLYTTRSILYCIIC